MSLLVAAVTTDQDISVNFFKETPTQIKARGQAILTEHPLSGAFMIDSF
jgi:hypothetical protein